MSIVLVTHSVWSNTRNCGPGPLCNEPVPIPPGEDPNIRMERHLAVDCSVMTGRRAQKASATPKCARPKCGKLLFAQIQCDVSSPFCFSQTNYRSFDLLSRACRNATRSSARNIVSRVRTTVLRSHRLFCPPHCPPHCLQPPALSLVGLVLVVLLPLDVLLLL